MVGNTLREESSQTNVILQYKLLAAILSAVCSVIQQSYVCMYCTSITHYMMRNMTVKLQLLDHISATVFCATKQPPIQL